MDAQRIERDVEDCYKAEYMTAHLGETYTGTVSGVTQRGVFVALENTVEGFVPPLNCARGSLLSPRASAFMTRSPVATGCWVIP